MLLFRHLPRLALLAVFALPIGRMVSAQALDLPRQDLDLDRAGRVLRDKRLSFSARAADRARTILQAAESDASAPRDLPLLSSALLCLGAGGEPADLVLLERFCEVGKLSLRRAAVFGIGEMGIRGFASLERVLGGHLVGAEEVALLALIHMDQASAIEPRVALQRALDACNDPRPGLSQAALFLREYALGGPAPAALPALDSYYDLRWSAACAFGFVDGLRWKDLKAGALLNQQSYLNRFVLGLAQGLEQDALSSHLIELLAYEHGPGCAAGVAIGLPGVIPALYNDAGWRPSTLEEWSELIEAIEFLGDAEGYGPFLGEALLLFSKVDGLSALRDRAAFLLLESGGEVPRAWVAQAIASSDSQIQSRLLEIAGGLSTEKMEAYARQLLARSESPVIAIKAQLALARMGDEKARAEVSGVMRNAPPNVRLITLEAMARVSHDPSVRLWIGELLDGVSLDGEVKYAVSLALAWGTPAEPGRVELRAALRSSFGTRRGRLRALRLLLLEPGPEDQQLFRDLFPVEGELEFNLLLARGLAGKYDPHTMEALRRVLWGEQWNMGVIAGGISRQMFGTSFLLDELNTPPADATAQQLRCVGFALGEWAGLSAVEELARTQTARDPALQGAYLGALSSSVQ